MLLSKFKVTSKIFSIAGGGSGGNRLTDHMGDIRCHVTEAGAAEYDAEGRGSYLNPLRSQYILGEPARL